MTQTENIAPKYAKTQRMIIRLWADKGENFNPDMALQDGSVVFSPDDGSITFSGAMTPPLENRTDDLKEKVKVCISKLLSCLEEEIFPMEQQRIKDILGDTIVVLSSASQQEMGIFSRAI